jgi:hypothetical protein
MCVVVGELFIFIIIILTRRAAFFVVVLPLLSLAGLVAIHIIAVCVARVFVAHENQENIII